MKNIKSIASLCLGIFVSISVFANNGETPVSVNTKKVTVKELKATYGESIVVEGNFDLSSVSTITVVSSANPCSDFPDFDLCGPVSAEARRIARNFANECCCDVVFGYECCDPSTGSPISVLFLTQAPANCN